MNKFTKFLLAKYKIKLDFLNKYYVDFVLHNQHKIDSLDLLARTGYCYFDIDLNEIKDVYKLVTGDAWVSAQGYDELVAIYRRRKDTVVVKTYTIDQLLVQARACTGDGEYVVRYRSDSADGNTVYHQTTDEVGVYALIYKVKDGKPHRLPSAVGLLDKIITNVIQ